MGVSDFILSAGPGKVNVMEDKEKPRSKAGTIIGIGFLAFVLFFYVSMWLTGLVRYSPKHFCSVAESDANTVAAAIADYFSVAEHTDIARSDIEKLVSIVNPWTFTRRGDNFYVHVVDRSGECPAGRQNMDSGKKAGIFSDRAAECPAAIQYNDLNWNAGIYTKSLF